MTQLMKGEAEIREWLTEYVADVLQVGRENVKADISFQRLGLDSASAVGMTGDLEVFLGRKMPPSLPYDYPDIEALSRVLASGRESADLGREARPVPTAAPRIGVAVGLSEDSADSLAHEVLVRELQSNAQHLASLNLRIDQMKERGCYFYEPLVSENDGAWAVVNGRRMLVMASYSYLGLIGHPEINDAACEAVRQYGTGTHGVRLLAGTVPLHRELEQCIAQFKGTEDAVVYSSGFMTNLTTIATLIGEGGWVISDTLNHASIVDGCVFSNAHFAQFNHNDMRSLEGQLKQAGGHRKLVVADAVFSMDGDILDLPEVVRLCRKYGAMLMVDEAHSLGVLGDTGHGIAEHCGMAGDVIDVQMGTLSKTIPSVGGYVAAKAEVVSALKHNARGYIFSAALPPPQAAAAKAAFEVIGREPARVRRLSRNRDRYVTGLRAGGLDVPGGQTPVVPIICGTEERAFEMTRLSQAEGLFVLPVVFPAVPKGAARLRTTVTAAHTDEDVDFAVDVLGHAAARAGV